MAIIAQMQHTNFRTSMVLHIEIGGYPRGASAAARCLGMKNMKPRLDGSSINPFD
jgi:hypothetical protein